MLTESENVENIKGLIEVKSHSRITLYIICTVESRDYMLEHLRLSYDTCVGIETPKVGMEV